MVKSIENIPVHFTIELEGLRDQRRLNTFKTIWILFHLKETMDPTQNKRVEPWQFKVLKPFIYYELIGKRIVIKIIFG